MDGNEEGTPPAEAEMIAMKLSVLKKRARKAGVDEERLEEADDADDIKGAVITLIVEADRAAHFVQLRRELESMKLSAVKKRARDAGVDEEKLEEADDADDIKVAVIDLIVAAAQESAVATVAAKPKDDDLRKLREELATMKLSTLKHRAKEAGVDESALEEADDADDIKTTVIELIVGKARKGAPLGPVPHQGSSGAGDTAQVASLFGSKHVILSYQWDVQEEVKAVRDVMKAMGVPTWMDIDGGMKTDIYDSMAEGIGNICL